MRQTARRRPGFGATRQAIIEAARAVMREEGVGGLSLHEVARRLEMKTPSLYTYFDSKHGLYDEIFRLGIEKYRAELSAIESDIGRTADLLDAVVVHYVRFADENPELYSLLFERPVPGFEPSEASMVHARELLDHASEMVRALLENGAIDSGLSVELTRDIVLVVMHGLTSLKRANEPSAAISEGRFGVLLPHVIGLLRQAWIGGRSPQATEAVQ